MCGYDHHTLQTSERVLSVAEAAISDGVLLQLVEMDGCFCISWHAYSLSVPFVLSMSTGCIGLCSYAATGMLQAHAQYAGPDITSRSL
jgi:hypothetical protein